MHLAQVEGRDLVGHAFCGLTVSWHEHRRVRHSPMHFWLDMAGLGWVQLSTRGDGRLRLTLEKPYEPYDMPELESHVTVDYDVQWDGLTEHRGATIRSVRNLVASLGDPIGLVLVFDNAAVGVANLYDETDIAPWPSAYWDPHRLTEAEAHYD